MAMDGAVEIVAEDGDGGGWVWWTATADGTEVEAEDHQKPDTKLSRA
jgi:hypothetical protein